MILSSHILYMVMRVAIPCLLGHLKDSGHGRVVFELDGIRAVKGIYVSAAACATMSG
jgi:hypothetical protein